METGVIIKGVGGRYDVAIHGKILSCRARGILKYDGIIPMAGDLVEVDTQKELILKILPRINSLTRPPIANISRLGIVLSIIDPEPDLILVDKLILFAELNQIEPFLIINKIDLVSEQQLHNFMHPYKLADFKILAVSARTGSGIKSLKAVLAEGVTAFAGQSGAGKSSILNCLLPHLDLETGDISQKVKRGKHTTRHVELLFLPTGGMVADTPGFSILSLESIDETELQLYYPEFTPYWNQCYFKGCLHHHEPNCKIKEMVSKKIISKERYKRYIRILEELQEKRRDLW